MRIQTSVSKSDESRVRKFLTRGNVKQSRGLFDILNAAIIADGGKPLTILKHGGARRVKTVKKKARKNERSKD